MSAENLSQMGAAKVQRLVDQYGQQVIDKCPVSPVEYAFYEHAAEELNSRGDQNADAVVCRSTSTPVKAGIYPWKSVSG